MSEAQAAADAGVIEKATEPVEAVDTAKATETAADAGAVEKAAETQADAADATAEAGKGESTADEFKWADDWRERMAGGDDVLLRQLKRYSSPATFAKGFKERDDMIRSGKIAKPMPDAADEKAMVEWRKEQGIPDDPSGYKLPEVVTKALTDADKPMLASFTEFAHKRGGNQAAVDLATEWYVAQMDGIAEQQAQADTEAAEAAEDALRKEWSPGEFKANGKLAGRFLEGIPGIGTKWTEVRAPDGRRFGDIPEFMIWASDMGRERFGDAVFASDDSARKHTARKTEIEQIMSTNLEEYYQKGLDKEYATILEREAKRASR